MIKIAIENREIDSDNIDWKELLNGIVYYMNLKNYYKYTIMHSKKPFHKRFKSNVLWINENFFCTGFLKDLLFVSGRFNRLSTDHV